MYSVVLMMAMTTAPEAPNFGGKFASCHGCYSNCHGNGAFNSGHGYGGGLHASYGFTCHGSLYSCHGCWGGIYTPYSCQGYGIYGGASYMWPTPYHGGGAGCYGYGYPVPVYPPPKIIIEEKKKIEPDPKKTMRLTPPDQAQVIVRLPADAKLYANGHPTALTSSERAFLTPALEQGRDFQYTLQVEYARNGKTYSETQVVKVRAGQASVAEFADASRTDTVVSTIKFVLPEGAKVYVENNPKELPSGTKEFKTPDLLKGLEYAYLFRAELTRDGKKQEQSQRVVFKSGEPVTVDFSDMATTRTASK